MSNLDNLPWHVEAGRDYEDGQPNGFIVAAPATKAGSAGRAIAWVKEEAVAHVVAAAPDMLAALKDLIVEIDTEVETRQYGGNDEAWADLEEKANRARAAIAKAEGRA